MRALLLAVACGTAFHFIASVAPAAAQTTTIGIYSDVNGSVCSLSDTSPGIKNSYVVVRPGPQGVAAVQFAAPMPACFTGTYMTDVDAPGTLTIGNSQSAVSVALGLCSNFPVHVLTIQYYGLGTTPTCCPYPVIADPEAGEIMAVSCSLMPETATGIVSMFNADASCECFGNSAPSPPGNPSPLNHAMNQSRTPVMSWDASDVDNNIAEYDLYLGTTASPPLVAPGLTEPNYTPGPLDGLTQYYWRVVVRDTEGLETSGDTWTFTTRVLNTPPNAPTGPAPNNGDEGVYIGAPLIWVGTDPDGDALVFDVYFGTSSSPPLVATGVPINSYSPGTLAFLTKYYWRVVARDPSGAEASGPVWSFTTQRLNHAPDPPQNQSPANNATGVASTVALHWTGGDPDFDLLEFDIFFGTTPTPPLIATVFNTGTYTAGGLDPLTTYYWRIRARDPGSATASGPTWSFTTREQNLPPAAPSNPSPPNAANDQPLTSTLAWQCSDPEGDALTYDVYFGTSGTPPLVATNVATTAYAPGALSGNRTYRWRIVARDVGGGMTSGPTWLFTTKANNPPNAPTDPDPPTNGFSSSLNPVLSWTATDPDGQPLTFLVFFGTFNPPPFAGGSPAPVFSPGQLVAGQRYYWQVIAGDGALSSIGPVWNFLAADGGPVPTLITRFDAATTGSGVKVSWELWSDDVIERVSLLRREGESTVPVTVGNGSIDAGTRSYLDDTVIPGRTYRYELLIRTHDGNSVRSPVATVTLAELGFTLYQNQPNPFNPQTTIRYDIPAGSKSMRVRLLILDIAGRVIRTLVDENMAGGSREAIWDGRDDRGSTVSSGVYFYVLDAGKDRQTRKLVLLK